MAKYFFLTGSAILIVGLVAGYVATEWSFIPLAIAAVGGVVFLAGLILATQKFWRRRSTQMGVNAFVATIAFVTIIGLLNFLGVRYGKTIDLTENNLYTLAPQSQQLVEQLENPLTVVVFEYPPSQKHERLLENYQKYSDNFDFEFVDPQTNLAKAQKFGVQSYGEVYLQYGEETQFVQNISETQSLSEVKLTSAIQKIQRDRVSFVYFLQGHGEPPLKEVKGGLSQAVASLKEQGYQVQPFNFAEESNLPDSPNSVLIIASPKQELFPGEVESIQKYLAGGGKILLMLDPDSNSGLDPIFETWGIQLDDRVIVDASGQGEVLGFNPATALVTRYGDHPITNPFGNGISVYPIARPVDFVEPEGVKGTPLALSNEKSWAESNTTQEQLEYNPERDRQGPLVLSFALEQREASANQSSQNQSSKSNSQKPSSSTTEETPAANNSETDADQSSQNQPSASNSQESSSPTEDNQAENNSETDTDNKTDEKTSLKPSQDARIVIFGDSDFAKNGLFVRQLNGDMFLNSIDWLTNRGEASLALQPKEQTNRRINLDSKQTAILSRTAMGIVPLIGLILAIISWLRRR
ncbi:MAG: ABC transporter [Cyanobacteria bacterium SW_9_44_58]|nr:MAG: ABC transporter [Cyanobacteria bacterium SW_9_44_58]